MKNVLEYLESKAASIPDKVAVADETTQLTFAELAGSATACGAAFSTLVEPRTPIPLLMEKSCATLSLMLGAVEAGCFYACLDPTQPPSRLATNLQTLEANLVVVNQDTAPLVEQLQELGFAGQVLHAEELLGTRVTDGDRTRLAAIRAQTLDIDPLYLIFTSGSTGTPKGIAVSHRSVLDFIPVFDELMGITGEDVIGNQAPFDFDVSVKDIYSMLYTGATMHIIPTRAFALPTTLLDFLEERGCTTLIWAVTALCLVTTLKGFKYKVPPSIRTVIFSGEVMPIKHLNAWREVYPEARFFNVYGPTEITCNCMYYEVDREFTVDQTLPLGFAIPNEKVFLLDEDDHLVDSSRPNELGELCVSGTCLALGYYNNPEQTAKAFCQNPLNSSYLETIYRTGDLAYYDEQGEMYFSSRKDFQIKHMGRRIELGEIEAAADALPQVTRCCCVYREDKKRISLFCEMAEGCDWTDMDIREAIKDSMPDYMLPKRIILLESLPISSHGKIDRVALKQQAS